MKIVTDSEGRFRIELPPSFVDASARKRTVGLAGSEDRTAFFDARSAIAPGVHDIGDLLLADPEDPRALLHLSDDRLISRLGLLRHWSSAAFDACLQECARRGGQRIIAHLTLLEREESRDTTNIAVVTARNRASRLGDPLGVELVDDKDASFSCSADGLPTVRVAFVNRDPLRRTLRLCCTEPECHDESIAVECAAAGAGEHAFRLVRPSHEGMWPGGQGYELSPGEEVVVPVQLSHYLDITSPGRYCCRLAFRLDGSWDLADGAKVLPRGVLFLHSQQFLLDVGVPSGR